MDRLLATPSILKDIFELIYKSGIHPPKEPSSLKPQILSTQSGSESDDDDSDYGPKEGEYELDTQSWFHLNLTCKQWYQLCVELLPKLNTPQAFMRVLNSSFSCSGSLPQNVKVQIRHSNGDILLPPHDGLDHTQDIQKLLQVGKEASIGRGDKSVIDPSYRSAVILDSDSFGSNFHPSEFNINNDIRTILAPQWHHVTLQLYRLNVYQPGGFFKKHRDVSYGANHLGSLVVILPYPHQGGKLVVKRGMIEESLDASWVGGKKQDQIKWMAFFGNCEHWVEPVTSGYRITLTYNIFTSMNPESTVFGNEPVCSLLSDLIRRKQLTTEQKYGFFLQNEYSNEELNIAVAKPLAVLRGADAILYSAAIALKLKVEFRPIFRNEEASYDNYGHDDSEDSKDNSENEGLMMARKIPKPKLIPGAKDDHTSMEEFLSDTFEAKYINNSIRWCSPIPSELNNLAGSGAYPETESIAGTQGYYFHAIVILSVPKEKESKKKRKRKAEQPMPEEEYYNP